MGEFFLPPLLTHLNTHMNYLILTPDGVGSTILQRLITMTLYMEKHNVMNTHELTNGIEIQNGVAGKNFDLEYTQSLKKITDILQQSHKQTALVSRVAKYHLDSRNDPIRDCEEFYQFLNNFFERKIMCVRENIFEYAMSWSIRERSGVLNVYSRQDRTKVSQVTDVDETYFLQKCQEYVNYQTWIEKNFPKLEKVSYESILKDGDAVMEKLTGHKNTFENHTGMPLSSIIEKEYDFLKNSFDSVSDPVEVKGLVKYRLMCKELNRKGIVKGVPLKNTTLTDKKKQIKNFDVCLDKFYGFAKNHNWIDQSHATYDFWNGTHIC